MAAARDSAKLWRVRPQSTLFCLLLMGCVVQERPAQSPREAASSSPEASASAPTEQVNAFPIAAQGCTAGAALDWGMVHVAGRAEVSAANGMRLSWSGTRVTTKVVGESVQVALLDTGYNQFHVYLDGQLLPGRLVAEAGTHCYTLATKLDAREHELSLVRLTEPVWGETTLVSVHAREFRPVTPPARRLEIIGDSITTAYGIEGVNQFCKFTPGTQNFDKSYAALLGQRFHAQVSIVAWSGKGMFSNRGDTTDPMPVLWHRAVAQHRDSVWDFSRYQPDAVIINLGTNDFAPESADTAPFRQSYASFLKELRSTYPTAYLVCALGPLLNDEWPKDRRALTTARLEIRAAVAERHQAGDQRVLFFEHPRTSPSEGFGCDWHPSEKTHARMAADLAPALATALGWE